MLFRDLKGAWLHRYGNGDLVSESGVCVGDCRHGDGVVSYGNLSEVCEGHITRGCRNIQLKIKLVYTEVHHGCVGNCRNKTCGDHQIIGSLGVLHLAGLNEEVGYRVYVCDIHT